MERFGALLKTGENEGKEKHVPVIKAPDRVKADEFFEVTVVVGDQVPHPNTVEHHIKWIQIYAKPENHEVVHVGTFDLGPTYADPKVTFRMKLSKPATLYAIEYCNIHGLWESAKEIAVE